MKKRLLYYRKLFPGLPPQRYKGLLMGVLVGAYMAVGISVYATPTMLGIKSTSTIQHPNQDDSSNELAKPSASIRPGASKVSDQPPSTAQPNSKPTSTSTSDSTNKSATIIPKKQTPTIIGIIVNVPGFGQTILMSIPTCDYEYINSGTPETCHHYQPIPMYLLAQYSDGSTKQLSWSDASISSLQDDYPDLFSVNASNDTLIEGQKLGYFNINNSTVPMHVSYQSWSYTEYINVVNGGLWGQ